MKNHLYVVLCCGFLISFLSPSPAQATNASDTLEYFVGDWHCGVENAAGVFDPNGFSTASTEQLRGGWFATWILAFHHNTSDKMLATMRYDVARKHYVLFLKDDNGGYGMGIAEDWQNDALAFKGTFHKAGGDDVDFTQTFAVIKDGAFSLGWQIEGKTAEPRLICQK